MRRRVFALLIPYLALIGLYWGSRALVIETRAVEVILSAGASASAFTYLVALMFVVGRLGVALVLPGLICRSIWLEYWAAKRPG